MDEYDLSKPWQNDVWFAWQSGVVQPKAIPEAMH